MRNAGERVPSGASGRRHRAPGPETSPRTGGNGGASSLFTPAYRASHAAPGTYSSAGDRAGADPDPAGPAFPAAGGSGRSASDQPGHNPEWASPDEPAGSAWAEQDPLSSGYGWADSGQPGAGYDDAGDLPGAGYSWASDDLTSAGHSWSRTDLYDQPPAEPTVSNVIRGFPPAPGDPPPAYPPGPFAAWNRGAPPGPGVAVAEGREAGYGDSSRQLSAATITPTEFDTDYSLPAIKDPAPGQADRARTGTGPAARRQPPAPAATARSRSGGSHGRARQAGPPRSRRHGRPQQVRLAIGAAVVIVVAVAVVLFSGLGRTPAASHPTANGKHKSTPAPATPSATPPAGKWLYIGTRATDPLPLSGAELFPASFASAGVTYSRSATTGGKNCHGAVIGATLQTAVRGAGCTQEVRATYLSRVVKMMGTIGVFNLKSFTTASKAALAAGPSEFVAQLPAKTGPTHQIGSGTGIEEALVKGHYLILVWAEFLKLHAPKTTAQRQQLETFMNLLIRNTANTSLSYRMVDGKPSPAPG